MKAKSKKSKTGHKRPVPKRKTFATVIKLQASEIRKLKKLNKSLSLQLEIRTSEFMKVNDELLVTKTELEKQLKLVSQYKEFINTTIR